MLPLVLLISVFPAFADTSVVCNGSQGVNSTVITCPNIPQTTTNQPYYTNPQPSNSIVKDFVNTIFSKVGQATVQMSGQNGQVQNVTNGMQQVVDTGIDYVSAIKYLVTSLLGLIVTKVFNYSLPWFFIPALEWSIVGLTIFALLKKAWKIFLVALIIGILILLVVYVGGVVFH